MRPVLEYGSSVWDPPSIQEEVQKVQKRAVIFVTGNCIYETVSDILEQLKWESLKKGGEIAES